MAGDACTETQESSRLISPVSVEGASQSVSKGSANSRRHLLHVSGLMGYHTSDPVCPCHLGTSHPGSGARRLYTYLLGSRHTLTTGLRALPRSRPRHLGCLDTCLVGNGRD